QGENGEKTGNPEMPERGMGAGRHDRPSSDTAPETNGGNIAVTGVCTAALIAAIFGASFVKKKF
ncbi:MAG: hypothetical protein K2J73_00020, partial [Oscillospiraceae bacterium]|nr:hypothetical protein [Oscillospiraceae bacterium]